MKTAKSDTEVDLHAGCTFGNRNTCLEVGLSCGSELDFTAPLRSISMKSKEKASFLPPSFSLILSGQSCETREQAGIC